MASPQKEHGFTPIAHELLRAFIKSHLSGKQWEILMTIAMDSYGQSRKESHLSLAQIAQIIGCSRQVVTKSIRPLMESKMLLPPSGSQTASTLQIERRINKDYDGWGGIQMASGSQTASTPGIQMASTPRTRVRKQLRKEVKTLTTYAPDGRVSELVGMFYAKLQERVGEKPVFNGGQAGRAFKSLLRTFAPEEIKKRIESWFQSTDPFIVKVGFTPGLFVQNFNNLKGGPIHAIVQRHGTHIGPTAAVGKYENLTNR